MAWWDSIYDDAKNIRLNITSFDLYRRTIEGNFISYTSDSMKQILESHGKNTDTYALAKAYFEAEKEGHGWTDNYTLKQLLLLYMKILDAHLMYKGIGG